MVFDFVHIDCCILDSHSFVVVLKHIDLAHSFVLADCFVFDIILVVVIDHHFDCCNFDYDFVSVGMSLVFVLERFALDFDNYAYNFFDFLVNIDFDLEHIHFVSHFVQFAVDFVDCIDYIHDFHNFVGMLDLLDNFVVVDKIIAVVVVVDKLFVVDNKHNFQSKFCR